MAIRESKKSEAKTSAIQPIRLSLVVAALFGIGLSGCAGLPEDQAALPQGEAFVTWVPRNFSDQPFPLIEGKAAESSADPQQQLAEKDRLPRPTQTWWNEFESQELTELVESALANNYDLRVAVARIEQAERQALIAQAARYPSLDLFGRTQIEAPSGGIGTAQSRADFKSQTTYQFGFRTSYEVDLWGKVGFQSESALAQTKASIFNRQAVALTLTAEVATTYFQILSLNERISISEQNLEIALTVANAISRRVEEGDAPILDLQRQQVTIALIQNTQANLRLTRERLISRLAVFMGKPPSTVQIRTNSLQGVKVPQVSPGLPSEMLCRRPDIRRAEAQLQAASADVNAARANLMPSISLTAEFGQGSLKLSELLQPQSLLYNAAANIVQSIFDYDRKENQLASTRSRNRELLDTYANTVLSALRDVEDALSGIRLTAMQQEALAEALRRNSQLLEMSQRIYQRGALDYVALLDTQRDVFQAQDAEASARFEQIRSSVDLFKALGGGIAPENDPCIAKSDKP
jgi:NodT family efflux transporter outer membrane factor (OMF) lipoprotein